MTSGNASPADSAAEIAARTAAGAYVVLSSYQKGSLRGDNWTVARPPPMFAGPPKASTPGGPPDYRKPYVTARARCRPLPSDLPEELTRFGALLRHQTLRRNRAGLDDVALALKYTSTPLRWEPEYNQSIHRALPSPRSFFSSELFLVAGPDCLGPSVSRYLPDYLALTMVRSQAATRGIVGDAQFAFVIVGHHARVAKPYGEFSNVLVGLEAGFAAGQLSLMCAALGWRTQTKILFDDEAVESALDLPHWSQTPLVIVQVHAALDPEVLDPDAWRDQTISEPAPSLKEPELYPRVREMARTSRLSPDDLASALARLQPAAPQPTATPPMGPPALAGEDEGARDDLLAVVRRRSSGILTGGLALDSRRAAPATLGRICDSVAALRRLGDSAELRFADLSAFVYVLAGPQAGLHRLDLDTGELALLRPDVNIRRLQKSFASYLDVTELNYIFALTADVGGAIAKLGPRAFNGLLLSAGETGEMLALAAARHGHFARPVRAYQESVQETDLPLDQEMLLQVVVGTDRRAGPQFELG